MAYCVISGGIAVAPGVVDGVVVVVVGVVVVDAGVVVAGGVVVFVDAVHAGNASSPTAAITDSSAMPNRIYLLFMRNPPHAFFRWPVVLWWLSSHTPTSP